MRIQDCIEEGKRRAEAGEYAAARAAFTEALSAEPDNGEALFELGKTCYRSGDLACAETMLARAVRQGAGMPFALLLLGKTRREAGETGPAIETFERMAREGMADGEVFRELGDLYRGQGALERAEEMYLRCMEKEGGREALARLAQVYAEGGRHGKIVELSRRAGDGEWGAGVLARALYAAYRATGDLLNAERLLEETAAAGRAEGWTHAERGKICRERGETDRAAEEFGKALALEPGDDAARYELGCLYREKGEFGRALEEFRKIGRTAGLPRLQQEIAELYAQQDRFEEARSELGKTLPPQAGAEAGGALPALVRMLLEKGEHAAAASRLREYRENGPAKDDPFLRNKVLSAAEFLEKKTVLESKPYKMAVCLTGKCNLRCMMCYEKNGAEASWELPDRTAGEIIELLPYLKDIQWRGGEVFLSKHFEELFTRAAEYPRLRQGITTNGLLIDEKWADRLLGAGVKLDLSIDGLTEKTYEYVRRGASFRRLIRSLELLADRKKKYAAENALPAGPLLHLTFVVMRSNVHEMERIPAFARTYGIDVVQFIPLTFFSPGEDFNRENVENYPELIGYLDDLMPRLGQEARAAGIRVDNVLPFTKKYDFWELKRMKRRDEDPGGAAQAARGITSCCYPWNSLFIDFGGVVMSQCSKGCNMEIGNVTGSSLLDIWNGDAAREYRRNIVENYYDGACNPYCNPNIMPEDPTYLELF